MRKIGDHFTNDRGQPAFHFGVMYADAWGAYGFPKLTVHQMAVWSYLYHRTCHHHCSISEVARKVWGTKEHRTAARSTLMKLEELGLVGLDDGGWFSIMPEITEPEQDESGGCPEEDIPVSTEGQCPEEDAGVTCKGQGVSRAGHDSINPCPEQDTERK